MRPSWAAGLLLACAGLAFAQGALTDRELKAKLYEDLGADTIDLTLYPKEHRQGYQVFARTCAQCHTLARPINSAIASREDWRRFVKRMHARTMEREGVSMSAQEASTILEFLVFDSERRKIQRKAEFETETALLKARFELVSAQRERDRIEDDKLKARPYPDVAAPRPQSQP